MPCAYCKQERGYTGEHLIPMSILNMFPECDINFTMENTYKSDRIVINDVCGTCNNGVLSQLDGYGAALVQANFAKDYEKDDELELSYDYPLFARWILKILFNNARRHKLDTNWFDANLDYIVGIRPDSTMPFSIFAGLAVDMTPVPEFYMDNLKIAVYFNPMLLRESMFKIEGVNKVSKRENLEELPVENVLLKGLIRFGSSLFFIILWDSSVTAEYKKSIEAIVDILYPYSLIVPEEATVTLERATHIFNYHQGTFIFIDTNVGLNIVDNTNFFPKIEDPIQKRKDDSVLWNDHVAEIRANRAQRRQNERENRKKNKKK